jgi:hypothetical protein
LDVIQFHVNNKCCVDVKPLNVEVGCIVSFPANKLTGIKENTITYILDKNVYEIEIYGKNSKQPRKIKASKFNIRLLVIEDIILKALDLGLSKDLIRVEDGAKLFDILSVNISDKDLTIETLLCKKFRKLLCGEVDNLEDVEGYQQLVTVFENGGF